MDKRKLLKANQLYDQIQQYIIVLSYLKNGAKLTIRTPQGDNKILDDLLPEKFYENVMTQIKECLQYHLDESQKEFDNL